MARYERAVLDGRAFSAATPTAGVAPGTTIGTSAPLALYNPIGSGVNCILWKVSVGYVSGTLGSGYIALCANTNTGAQATIGSVPSDAACAFLGNVNGYTAKGQPLYNATLPVAPVVLRPIYTFNPVGNFPPIVEDIDLSGEFVIAPGATLSIQGAGTGGVSPLIIIGMSWEEHPLDDSSEA